jgi:signal peptidase II
LGSERSPDDGGDELEPVALGAVHESAESPDRETAHQAAGSVVPRESRRPLWGMFAGLALIVVSVDQATKAWIVANIGPGESISLVGDLLRLVLSRNTGGLFGLFRDQAPVFAALSIVVVALIAWYHGKSGRSLYLSLTLGLLMGGAIGNLIDRLRYGYVVDFVDAGIGNVRFYTFNVADMGISASLLLLILLAVRPSLAESTLPEVGEGTGRDDG